MSLRSSTQILMMSTLLRGLGPHGGPRFLGRRDPVRNLRAARLRRRDAAPRRAIDGGAGERFVPHVERRAIGIRAEAHRRADAEVGAALQVRDERRTLDAHVNVRVDDRRHDRLAGEAHARRAGRDGHVGGSAYGDEAIIAHEQRRVLDRPRAVADDDASAFERRHPGSRRGAAGRGAACGGVPRGGRFRRRPGACGDCD